MEIWRADGRRGDEVAEFRCGELTLLRRERRYAQVRLSSPSSALVDRVMPDFSAAHQVGFLRRVWRSAQLGYMSAPNFARFVLAFTCFRARTFPLRHWSASLAQALRCTRATILFSNVQ